MATASRFKALVACGLLAWLSGCIEPYAPNVPAAAGNYLVVNGFINSQGPTTILLSRSQQLNATEAPPAETKATVAIQAAGGQRFPLTENPAGTYTSGNLSLNAGLTYQLRITTAGGREYMTDFLAVKTAPPIDKLNWRYENAGVQIYVSAHDDSRSTVYYRWKYEETWQFTSAFQSRYQYNATTKRIEPRTEDIYHCWRTNNSTAVTQANTTRLSQDAVVDFPLTFIPANSERLPIKYSILVKQYAQSKDEYDYWETLKKNTESLGTINDPLPTQLTGNVRCLSNPDEPVLGYVGVHSVSEQRIFIARADVPLPQYIVFETGYGNCPGLSEQRIIPREPPPPPGATYVFDTPYYLPTSTSCDGVSGCDYLTAAIYFGAAADCVDCRLRGTNVKPSFWK